MNNIKVTERALFLYISRNEIKLEDACKRSINEILTPTDVSNICRLYDITINDLIIKISNKVLEKIFNPTVLYGDEVI